MRGLAAAVLLAATSAAEPTYVPVEGGALRSVLPPAPQQQETRVAPFRLRRTAVTNRDFLAFVIRHPEWRRGTVAALFADGGYLRHWAGPLTLGAEADAEQPVTQVSWFAARAYCAEEERARLPTWSEWEYVAAASESARDARQDPAWRQRILDWYAVPGDRPLARVGGQPANFYGIQDLHGAIWEWVEDFNSLLVSADNREQGDPDRTRFCGSGALSMEQKENYAVLMRIALLSSLQAAYTTRNLGFRCARGDAEPGR
ncbi:MAG: formylglycine-generating enzyme family protein [Deltaproteobacteria bacterium]|nr:formylglycine-generating enzyme family protein [Deltaproteobacteria bacterium]